MELITKFKDILYIFNMKKMDDPTLFGEIQKAIAIAFNLPCAEDIFDNHYNYIVSIDKNFYAVVFCIGIFCIYSLFTK